jgi:hypothetical protein
LVGYEDEFGRPLTHKNELRTCFQIWRRSENPRALISIPDNGLVQKVAPADADIAMRVFGFGCGKVLREFDRIPNTTLMFLKIQEQKVWDVIDDLDYQRFTKNTAYTEALAFTELNYLLNERLFGDGLAQRKSSK